MSTIPFHTDPTRSSDTDDEPQHDDIVVVLLEVAIPVTFALILGLALFWIR